MLIAKVILLVAFGLVESRADTLQGASLGRVANWRPRSWPASWVTAPAGTRSFHPIDSNHDYVSPMKGSSKSKKAPPMASCASYDCRGPYSMDKNYLGSLDTSEKSGIPDQFHQAKSPSKLEERYHYFQNSRGSGRPFAVIPTQRPAQQETRPSKQPNFYRPASPFSSDGEKEEEEEEPPYQIAEPVQASSQPSPPPVQSSSVIEVPLPSRLARRPEGSTSIQPSRLGEGSSINVPQSQCSTTTSNPNVSPSVPPQPIQPSPAQTPAPQSTTLAPQPPASNKMKFVIVDTDCGKNDLLAIHLIASSRKSSNINILGITTTSEESKADADISRIKYLLKHLGDESVPILKGCCSTLVGEKPSQNLDPLIMGDFSFIPVVKGEDKFNAAQSLVDTVNKYPGKVTLVCLGPLTNVALAILLDPDFINKLDRLIIYGGSLTGLGCMEGNEYNFFADPEAAKIVLDKARSDKVTLIPVDTSCLCRFPMSWRHFTLGSKHSMDLHNKIFQLEKRNHETSFYFYEELAAAALVHPGVVEHWEDMSLSLETGGVISRGALFYKRKYPNVRVITRINQLQLINFLTQTL